MTPQVALPPADREMNLAKIESPGMALGEGSALFSSRPQQTAVPSDFNPQDWIFPAATASRDSPEGGEALPLSLYPQQWGAPSAFTSQACMPPTLMDMNFGFTPASVVTGPCGGGVAGWAGAAVGACVGGAAVAVVLRVRSGGRGRNRLDRRRGGGFGGRAWPGLPSAAATSDVRTGACSVGAVASQAKCISAKNSRSGKATILA